MILGFRTSVFIIGLILLSSISSGTFFSPSYESAALNLGGDYQNIFSGSYMLYSIITISYKDEFGSLILTESYGYSSIDQNYYSRITAFNPSNHLEDIFPILNTTEIKWDSNGNVLKTITFTHDPSSNHLFEMSIDTDNLIYQIRNLADEDSVPITFTIMNFNPTGITMIRDSIVNGK